MLLKNIFIKKFIHFFILKCPKLFWKYRPNINNENKLNNYFYEILLKHIGKNYFFKLLEYGCSNGILIGKLRKKYKNAMFYGVDISIKNINIAKKKFSNYKDRIKFSRSDILDTKTKKIDYIVSQATLIYLDNSEIIKFFNNLFNSKFKKAIFLELGSNTKKMIKTHFYSHPYENILKKKLYRYRNIECKIKKLKINFWYFKNKDITPRLIIVKNLNFN